jgi:hypothetical protein
MFKSLFRVGLAAAGLALLGARMGGCQGAYYRALEAVGVHKRDLLVERVQAAQAEQDAAKQQFTTVLEHFSSLVGFEGGDLQAAYERAKAEYDRSRSRAGAVHERIDAVESVGGALFDEWKGELAQYQNAGLRRASQEQLEETRAGYDQMLRAMRKAEKTMDPVLGAFNDQVLYLKHNLNARAVASLGGNLAGLQEDIDRLVREMEASIDEADRFVRQMSGPAS